MVDEVVEGETYWYVHTALLSEYPKQVTAVSVTDRVSVFNEYIGNEKFGETNLVKEGLFYTEMEAQDFFIQLLYNGEMHFIEKDTPKFREMYNYYVEEMPHVLIN